MTGHRWFLVHGGSLALAAALAVLPQGTPPPQQQPTFRTNVRTVSLYATVTDEYGDIVTKLTRDDFEVYDNGKLQEITVFSNARQPITVILLFDTSNSMTLHVDAMKAAAESFIIRLLPGDKARIGSFNDQIIISPRFTEDRDELLHIVRDGIRIANPTLLWDAVSESLDAVSGQDGRRVTIVFTDGADTISKHSRREVAHRAVVEGSMVYTLWFRGNFRLVWDQPTDMRLPLDEDLRKLAKDTGGAFLDVRRVNLSAALARIAEDLHQQYVLGFTPTVLDNKMHDLEVRMKRKGFVARSRKAYLATPEK